MKVFISWSGQRSHEVALLLDEWLQMVLQVVNPWISSKDIDKGSVWFNEISDTLKEVRVGIVCLTTTNKDKPWILFEAGALAKGINTNKVCTFLIDLSSTDIGDPLAQFNHTFPTRESVKQLIVMLNSMLGERSLKPNVLDKVFDINWPSFESRFKKIKAETKEDFIEVKKDEDEVLNELLMVSRSLDKRMRMIENYQFENEARKRFFIQSNDGQLLEMNPETGAVINSMQLNPKDSVYLNGKMISEGNVMLSSKTKKAAALRNKERKANS